MRTHTLSLLAALALPAQGALAHNGVQHVAQAEAQTAPAEAPAPVTLDPLARIEALEAEVAALRQLLEQRTVPPAFPVPTAASPPDVSTAERVTEQNTHGHAMGGPGLKLGNVTVSGMVETQFTTALGGGLMQPVFSNPKGNADFVLTHVHPMLHATLSEKVSAAAMWCLTHMGATAVYEAYLEAAPTETTSVKMGRWLLPFGAWNPISNPTQYPSVSRPLMYLGHEERNIVPIGGPRPILNDEHSDIGLLVNGTVERGPATVGYAAYVSNGFHDLYGDFPDAWIDFRPSEDNNSRKSLGARLSATVNDLTLGASWTGGKYDPANRLDYRIWGVDATWRGPQGLTVRAEYANNPIHRDGAPQLKRNGWYAMADQRINPRWSAVALYSTLSERPAANLQRMSRVTLGLNYRLADTATLKTELGRLFMGRFTGDPADAPQGTDFDDVTTFKMSTVVSF